MRADVLNFNGIPYILKRKVWSGKFVDNLTNQTNNELLELWKEYTEADQIYQEGETLFFLQEIKELKWEEIL